MTKRLTAYTAPGSNYPPYINISRLHDGNVRFIVRQIDGACAEITIPAAVFKEMLAEIKVRDQVTGVA